MCRSKDDPLGEYRCNCDSSGKRRLRRKTTREVIEHTTDAILNPIYGEQYALSENEKPVDLETLVEESKSIKNQFLNSPQENTPEYAAFHQSLESRVTALGMHLACHIDADPRIKKLDEEYQQIQDTIDTCDEKASLQVKLAANYLVELKLRLKDENSFSEEEINNLSWDRTILESKMNELSPDVKETYNKLLGILSEIRKNNEETFDTRQLARQRQASLYEEMVATNEQVTLEYLKKFRDLGGRLKIKGIADASVTDDEKTNYKNARYVKKLLKESVSNIYPTEWIKKSNETPPPISIGLKKRAAYSSLTISDGNTPHDIEKPVKNILHFAIKDRELGAPEKTIANLAAALSKIEEYNPTFTIARELDPIEGPIFRISMVEYAGKQVRYDSAPFPDEEMRKQGWIQTVSLDRIKPHTSKLHDDPDALDALVEKNRIWVKPDTQRYNRSAALTVDTREGKYARVVKLKANEDPNKAIALHEFGHRMEDVLPHLKAQERAFLARRTGKTQDNWYYDMQSQLVSDNTIEYYHQGNFTIPYVGREYYNGSAEVFTVGIESAIGGNYGMLKGKSSGAEHNVADSDHRGFVLGILSSL